MARSPNPRGPAAEAAADRSAADQDIAEAIALLRQDLAALRTAVAGLAAEGSTGLHDRMRRQADEMMQDGGEQFDALAVRAETLRNDLRSYARRNPDSALAAAAGIGMFLGLILGRR